jgi:hypothetical protein
VTSEHIERWNGLDHVLTLSTPPFEERLLASTLHRRDESQITVIVPELNLTMLSHKQRLDNENVIVVPYPVFNEPFVPIKPSRESHHRRLLATGVFGLHGDGERLRRTLIETADRQSSLPQFRHRLIVTSDFATEALAEEKIRTYAEAVYNSVFCLSPAGDSLSTRRCVPTGCCENLG